MKKASMIIALIFGLFGIFGGACNFASSTCSAAKTGIEAGMGSVDQNQIDSKTEELTNFTVKGIFASFISALALIWGVLIGNSKSSKSIIIFSILLLVSGIISTILTNYFSGPMLAIAGIIGFFGKNSS